jgi:hypothetical protein
MSLLLLAQIEPACEHVVAKSTHPVKTSGKILLLFIVSPFFDFAFCDSWQKVSLQHGFHTSIRIDLCNDYPSGIGVSDSYMLSGLAVLQSCAGSRYQKAGAFNSNENALIALDDNWRPDGTHHLWANYSVRRQPALGNEPKGWLPTGRLRLA